MLTRSQAFKQHLYLTVSESIKKNREKRELRKRHSDNIYKSFKKRYSSKGRNLIIT